MSGSSEKRDDVGVEARLDRAALLARGAVGLLEDTPLPAAVSWNAGISSS